MALAIASNTIVAKFTKKAPAKKAPAKKAAAKRVSRGVKRQGNVGPNRTLWNGWEANPDAVAFCYDHDLLAMFLTTATE